MKIITTPMLLKLNLVFVFILFANVFVSSGQSTSNLATPSNQVAEIAVNRELPFNDAALNEYSTINHRFALQSAALGAPYNCEDGLVYILTNKGSSNGNITGLYSYNLGTKTQTLIKDPLVASTSSSQFINALGYNVKDNYLYGFLQGTKRITKMDRAGNIEYLEVTGDFTAGDYSSGDVDKNGVLYLLGSNKFVSINLNPSASDYLVGKTLSSFSTTVNDMAFSPIDDNLYMISSTESRTLFRFDINTNTIATLGAVTGLSAETSSSFGTAFMDSNGNMYISNNASGNIYKIALPHAGGLTAIPFNSLAGTPGDGARCPNQSVPPNAVDDQACGNGVDAITIDLVQNDGSGTYPLDLASLKLIDPSTNVASNKVTVSGQGTFNVNNSGVLIFTPVSGFTEATITYSISDTVGIVSNLATITVTANKATTPTGLGIQEFCQLSGLTIADLKVSGTSIKWYATATSAAPLPKTTPLKQATYYATQTTAAGCESIVRLAITVKLNSDVPPPSGSKIQEFCEFDALTIADLKVTGTAIKWYESATSTTALPSTTPLKPTTYYASQTTNEGCESVGRLEVLVKTSESITLVSPESTSCTNNKTAYVVEVIIKGTAPFIATGTGAPGKFTKNGNQTTTWTSSPINASFLAYDVQISDAKACNSLTLSGSAPLECLAAPFDCDQGLAFILTNTGTNQDDYVTGLYTLNLSTNQQNLVKYPLVEDTTTPNRFINGIGYNTVDNYLYGLLQNTNKIARIDLYGDVEYFEITGAFAPGYYSSGDMDESGNLYLYNGNKFVVVNLDPSSPNYLTSTDLLSISVSINDLAYNNLDQNLYMVTSSSTPKLLRYNVSTNTLDDLGLITGLESETTSSYGTAFMDSVGNLFIANNGSGNTYRIASPETGGVAALFYSSAMAGLQPGDGARCQNQITLPVANDDSACGTLDTDTIINIVANDGEGSYPLVLSSVRLVDPVSSESVTTVVIAGQGTFTIDTNGIATFSPLPTFTEASVQYTIKDTLLHESQLATITVYLNTTETPTGDAEQTFCESSEPTVADLSANGINLLWYDSATSLVSLKPTTALVDGAVYYGTQTSVEGCESLERLKVTVKFNADATLVSPEVATCETDGNGYTIMAIFTGAAPFTVTGTTTEGTWTDNNDGSYSWKSDLIASTSDYALEIKDANGCNTIVLSGNAPNCCTFEVICPTFAETIVECSGELPTSESLTIEQFESLGNGDGRIGDSSCGIIQITAANTSDGGTCAQVITRTYTITEYKDTNNNGVLDGDENTVLNTTECVQVITVQDTTAPSLVTAYETEISISCDNIPDVPDLVFEDACSNNMNVVFAETSTANQDEQNYVVTRTWTVSDNCDNEAVYTQTINVANASQITTIDTELCNDDDFKFDLFGLLSGTFEKDGTWSVVNGNATLEGSMFNPYKQELGTYTFMYTLSDDYCTSETLVNITLNDDCVVLPCGAEDVVISKAVTTYTDGKNDFFSVTGVETCGFTVELQIFNRWGAMIYESKNYQNDWNGTASKASIGSSNYVPTGTYYYVINLKNSGLKPFAGPIYVATK